MSCLSRPPSHGFGAGLPSRAFPLAVFQRAKHHFIHLSHSLAHLDTQRHIKKPLTLFSCSLLALVLLLCSFVPYPTEQKKNFLFSSLPNSFYSHLLLSLSLSPSLSFLLDSHRLFLSSSFLLPSFIKLHIDEYQFSTRKSTPHAHSRTKYSFRNNKSKVSWAKRPWATDMVNAFRLNSPKPYFACACTHIIPKKIP